MLLTTLIPVIPKENFLDRGRIHVIGSEWGGGMCGYGEGRMTRSTAPLGLRKAIWEGLSCWFDWKEKG
jgi:hypothetical protein